MATIITKIIDPGGTGDYVSLAEAQAGYAGKNLVASGTAVIFQCKSSNGAVDSTNVNFTGWATSPTNSLTVQNHSSEPINMKYDTNRYRLEAAYNGALFRFGQGDCTLQGLQINNKIGSASAGSSTCVYLGTNPKSGSYTIKSNVLISSGSPTFNEYIINSNGFSTTTVSCSVYVINNVFISAWLNSSSLKTGGCYISGPTTAKIKAFIYNNTFYSLAQPIPKNVNVTSSAYNNIYVNTRVNGAAQTFYDYNVSSLNSSTGIGANGAYNKSFTFMNKNTTDTYLSDLRLTSTDTGAMDRGTNLTADDAYPFNYDAFGTIRNETWDCGYHEFGFSSIKFWNGVPISKLSSINGVPIENIYSINGVS